MEFEPLVVAGRDVFQVQGGRLVATRPLVIGSLALQPGQGVPATLRVQGRLLADLLPGGFYVRPGPGGSLVLDLPPPRA